MSSISLSHNDLESISGEHDVKLDYTFRRESSDSSSSSNRWLSLNLDIKMNNSQVVDLSEFYAIKIKLKFSKSAYVQFYLLSDVYSDYEQPGNPGSVLWEKIGWYQSLFGEASVTLNLNQADYPSWADTDAPGIHQDVIEAVKGIRIHLEPEADDGYISKSSETGFVYVDNVQFLKK